MSRHLTNKSILYSSQKCLRKGCNGKLLHRGYSLYDCDTCGTLHIYDEENNRMRLENKKRK